MSIAEPDFAGLIARLHALPAEHGADAILPCFFANAVQAPKLAASRRSAAASAGSEAESAFAGGGELGASLKTRSVMVERARARRRAKASDAERVPADSASSAPAAPAASLAGALRSHLAPAIGPRPALAMCAATMAEVDALAKSLGPEDAEALLAAIDARLAAIEEAAA
ncbi:hypothetical protein FNF28_02208 [Cafeteria roenbergensis]|uniref:Uncharacterized protein n=1 Tax=Cafeteria roenbergensis TaxID=33653 RepID=A0A5A8DX55_CAFRO|nr:hypothetical protein FNF28_02208 [Cafeteria roenbergensis]